MKRVRKPTRITLILQAQERVAIARDQLDRLWVHDERFIDAVNEYSAAIEARKTEEGRTT